MPSQSESWRRVRALLIVLALVLAAAPAAAHASASWQSGPLQETYGQDCITGDPIAVAGSYMSYFADPANPPKVGDVFYLAIDATGIGDTCAGTYGDPQLVLPAGTSLAISAAHPVQCFLEFPGHSSFQQDTSSDCPQTLPLSTYGYDLSFKGVNPPFWPLPVGGSIEMNVPVVATASGALQFKSVIQTADGDLDETMQPTVLAIVNPAGTMVAQQFGIGYAAPSITAQTQSGATTNPVNVSILGYVYNHSNSGTAYAELGQPPHGSRADCTNPVAPTGLSQFYDTNSASLATGPNSDTQISGQFTTLYPAHDYCWRIVAHISTTTYYGNWSPFLTRGSHNSSDPEATTTTTASNCSETTGNGCSSSSCAGTNSCGAASCTGSACLTTFAPTLSTVPPPAPISTTPIISTPIPTPIVAPAPALLAAVTTKHTAKATWAGSKITVDSGFSVGCPPGPSSCAAKLTATTRVTTPGKTKHGKPTIKTVKVGTGKFTIAAGRIVILKFSLNSAGAALLRKNHALSVHLAGSYTGPTGTKALDRNVTIKQPVKPRKKR